MTTEEPLKGIYLGNRGNEFKRLVESLLKKGNLSQNYIDILTCPESMEMYAAAFTSEQVDEINNYQVYEQLGDLTGNKFIVWYIYKRFPQLKCAEGVKVAARLRINLGSKNSFSSIADKFGFWEFISAPNELRQRKRKPLLEDVFEAFLGVTETILDECIKIGAGYSCIYEILSSIFDEIPISLNYEDLYDAKTRLKELFDIFSDRVGVLKYEEKRDDLLCSVSIYRLEGGKYETKPDGTVNQSSITGRYVKKLIGQGTAALKPDAEQVAASNALKHMAENGYVKQIPSIYSKFNKNESTPTEKSDILKIIKCENKINDQFFTRGKSKYQGKYTSTILNNYCRKRDWSGIKHCMIMGADPNITDSEGMTCCDMLLIGDTIKTMMIRAIEFMTKSAGYKLKVHKNIWDMYGVNYTDIEKYICVIEQV
jgi:dsRNA-specific ribonuclease